MFHYGIANPFQHRTGVFSPFVPVDRLYPAYWSGPDYTRAEFKMPIRVNPLQEYNDAAIVSDPPPPWGLSGLGALGHDRAEEVEHAILGAAAVAAMASVIGCKKGWKLWTVGLGALLGAAGGYGFTMWQERKPVRWAP